LSVHNMKDILMIKNADRKRKRKKRKRKRTGI
jgi:hypothetical protein